MGDNEKNNQSKQGKIGDYQSSTPATTETTARSQSNESEQPDTESTDDSAASGSPTQFKDATLPSNAVNSKHTSQTTIGDEGRQSHAKGVQTTQTSTTPDLQEKTDELKLGFTERPSTPDVTQEVAEAREADWIVSTGRYPYVFDGCRLGFGIGHREESDYQWSPDEVSLPVHFLDNDYRDSDLDRFVNRVHEYTPEIAVIGDIYDSSDLDQHLDAAETLWKEYPDMEFIIVPKTEEILHRIPDEFVVGFPNGKSDIQGTDIASIEEWRTISNGIHILGGTPLSAYKHIIDLTEYYLAGPSPANIVGLDSNNMWKHAQTYGDYADASGGWNRNLRTIGSGDEYLPKRDLMVYSHLNTKHFWISKGVWPDRSPNDLALRDELVKSANMGRGEGSKQIVPTTDNRDIRQLAMTPPHKQDRHQSHLYRTDETMAGLIEPLSPIAAVLGEDSWQPDGILTGCAEYELASKHKLTSRTCPGCGANVIAEPRETVGGRTSYDDQRSDDAKLEINLVSYGHYGNDNHHHKDSIAQEGPNELTPASDWGKLVLYCSEQCRKSVEFRGRNPIIRDREKQGRPAEGEEIAAFEVEYY